MLEAYVMTEEARAELLSRKARGLLFCSCGWCGEEFLADDAKDICYG